MAQGSAHADRLAPAGVRLVPLGDDAYPAFLDAAARDYAQHNVSSGRWPAAGALERALAETERLLPQRARTPGHQVFGIEDEASSTPVGYLWMSAPPRGADQAAFVYQLMVHAEHRRKGYARAALAQAAALAAAAGSRSLGLHVFAHNAPALALYRAAGFTTISHNLSLPLAGGTADG